MCLLVAANVDLSHQNINQDDIIMFRSCAWWWAQGVQWNPVYQLEAAKMQPTLRINAWKYYANPPSTADKFVRHQSDELIKASQQAPTWWELRERWVAQYAVRTTRVRPQITTASNHLKKSFLALIVLPTVPLYDRFSNFDDKNIMKPCST